MVKFIISGKWRERIRSVHRLAGGGVLVPLLNANNKHNGSYLLLAHGTKWGTLPDPWVRTAREWNALVACCHPARVKETYPDLRVIGGWDSKTWELIQSRDAETITLCLMTQAECDRYLAAKAKAV